MSHSVCQTQYTQPTFFADPFFTEFAKSRSQFNPAFDIINKDKGVDIFVDVPGFSKEDLNIEVENGILNITGERVTPALAENDSVSLRERRFGSFKRQFRLGDHIDSETVQAKVSDGVLHIEIQRKEQALAKKITIA